METFLFWGGLVSLALAALWVAFLFRVELRVLRRFERRTTTLARKTGSED
jgi:hypothetical protein